MATVFVIFDREDRRPYLKKGWPTRAKAEAEMAGLLRFYPEDSEWRKRLHVAEASDFILRDERTCRPIRKEDALRSIQEAYDADDDTPAI